MFVDMLILISHDLSKGRIYWGQGGEEKLVMLLQFEKAGDAEDVRTMIVDTLRDKGHLDQLQIAALFKLCAVSAYYCLWSNGEITYTCSDPTGNWQ